MLTAQAHARTVHQRLRNPPNAVEDRGIDLKRVIPIVQLDAVQPIEVVVVPKAAPVDDDVFGPVTVERPKGTCPRVEDIQRAVARHFGISRLDMISRRRSSEIVRPRHVAAWFAREYTPRSYPEIGRLFGGRDHTSMLHAVRRIEDMRPFNGELESDIEKICAELGLQLRPPVQPTEAQDATPQPTAD